MSLAISQSSYFYQYLDLFNIEIVNPEVKDNKAYVKYGFIGPINLFMQAWEELSEENMKSIQNGGNSNINSPTEFRNLFEERIKKSIAILFGLIRFAQTDHGRSPDSPFQMGVADLFV
jgi:hypothetical protein